MSFRRDFKIIREGTILRYWTLHKANALYEPDLRITLVLRPENHCVVMTQTPGAVQMRGNPASYGAALVRAQDLVILYLRQGYHIVQGETVVKTYEQARKEAGIVLPEDLAEERFSGIGDDE